MVVVDVVVAHGRDSGCSGSGDWFVLAMAVENFHCMDFHGVGHWAGFRLVVAYCMDWNDPGNAHVVWMFRGRDESGVEQTGAGH